MRSQLLVCAVAVSLWGFFAEGVRAQIHMGSGSYAETFDSLATNGTANTWTDNATLPGWYAAKTTSPTAITVYQAGIGSATAGALYSFGLASSTERALGSIGSGGVGNVAYGLRFTNETALLQTNLTITYTGEQWRNGGVTAAHRLRFYYQAGFNLPQALDANTNSSGWIPFTNLDFVSPIALSTAGALDGNAVANRIAFNSVVMTNVIVPPGAELFLRWVDVDDQSTDHGLAIDDFSISFTGVVPPAATPPSIGSAGQPQSRTNNAGTSATFTVAAAGTGPLGYQWRHDDFDLFDGGNVLGVTTPTLTITNLLALDSGNYTVVVSNALNTVTSLVARLTVIDPMISFQPVSRTNVAGDAASFVPTIVGTQPLDFEWRKDGLKIPDAVGPALVFTNVQATNAGGYQVVVTNSSGSVTSAVATLTVVPTPAARLARWDFNSNPNDLNTVTGNTNSSQGIGFASLLSTNTGAFAGGASSDPASLESPGDNSGWNTAAYPAPDAGNKTGGVQFNASTAGYQDIFLTWEQRHSATASKYTRLQYSTDGVNFTDHTVLNMIATNSSFVFFSSDLSAIPGVNNNPNFAFRIVAEFENTATGSGSATYVGTAGNYGTAGTIRFDVLNVYGNVSSGRPKIRGIQIVSGEVRIEFTAGPTDLPSDFALVSSSTVEGTFSLTSGSSITSLGSGSFRATAPVAGGTQFYRIRR